MTARALLLSASLLALAAPAAAQDPARLDRVERSLKEVRAIVFQGRDTGQPVVVKPAGPDPQVEALEKRVGDLEQTLQRVNGQLDTATQQLAEVQKLAAIDRTAAAALADQVRALTDRVTKLDAPPAPPPPAPAPTPAPTPAPAAAAAPAEAEPAPTTRKARAAAATARAQAADKGALGAPSPAAASTAAAAAPAAPPATEPAAYRAARARLASGDYAGATTAWQDYTTRFASSPRAPEGRYRLGEAYYIQDNYPEAARAYATALRGWPKATWAPDATLKLAQSLAALNRPTDACAAASEFAARYGPTAGAALKTRLSAVQAKAKCAG